MSDRENADRENEKVHLIRKGYKNCKSINPETQVRNSLLQMDHLLKFTKSSYHSIFLPPRDTTCRRQISENTAQLKLE